MSDAERDEMLAKLAAIKAAVVELEASLSPMEVKPIVLFRFSGNDEGVANAYVSHYTIACPNPRDVYSEPLFYYGSLDPKDEK